MENVFAEKCVIGGKNCEAQTKNIVENCAEMRWMLVHIEHEKKDEKHNKNEENCLALETHKNFTLRA